MRILVVGAGGVGAAVAAVARRRGFFERIDARRPRRRARARGGRRPLGDAPLRRRRASTPPTQAAIAALARAERADAILNAGDPRFNPPIFAAAFDAGCTYLDMAMTLSEPHPERPVRGAGREARRRAVRRGTSAGRRPACSRSSGSASSPASRTSSPATPPTSSSPRSTRSASATARTSSSTATTFAPTFSIWTTIEECLNPPLIWERERGWYTTEPFSEPEVFEFPEGIGPVECVNVEHEEVVLIPRWIDCRRVTFKYGLGEEFIDVLRTLHKLGLDSTEPVRVRGVEVAPRDVVAAALPDPATLGDRMRGQDVRGHARHRAPARTAQPRATYLYHVADNEQTMREYGHQAVVLQTAINPVVALELLAERRRGRAPACSAPRRSRRRRSSTCSPTTARRTGSSNEIPA